MKNGRFTLMAAAIVIIQIVLTKYCQIGSFFYVCLLPAVVLCMPCSRPTWYTMIVAFVCGLLVDGLADGPLGLNTMPLVVVAALQKPLIKLLINDDCVTRGYSFSFHQNGYLSIAAALSIEVVVFFILYVIFDSAGARSFGFNLGKILISTLASIVLGMVVCGVLNPRQRN